MRKENVVKRRRGGSRERMKKRQIEEISRNCRKRRQGRGLRDTGQIWGNGKIESNREDSFYPVSLFL